MERIPGGKKSFIFTKKIKIFFLSLLDLINQTIQEKNIFLKFEKRMASRRERERERERERDWN